MKTLLYTLRSKVLILLQNERYKQFLKKYYNPRFFHFTGKDIFIYGSGKLEIGENSYIGIFLAIQSHELAIVRIDKDWSVCHNRGIHTTSKLITYIETNSIFEVLPGRLISIKKYHIC